MLRTIALHWPLLAPIQRLEVCARVAWLVAAQAARALVTLWAALFAASLAVAPLACLFDAARGAAAALLFLPMAIFSGVFFVVARAGFRRITRGQQAATRALSVSLAGIVTGHAVGGVGASSAAFRTRLALREPLAPPPGRRPSIVVTVVMVGVAAFGVLGGFSVHEMKRFKCRARQSEAKSALKAIHATELAWNGEKGTWLDLGGLLTRGGLDTRTVDGRYYVFRVERRANGFRATAVDRRTPVRFNAEVADLWTIDETSPVPNHVSDACD